MTTMHIHSQHPQTLRHLLLTTVLNLCIIGRKSTVFRLSFPLLLWVFGSTFAENNNQKTITRHRSTDPKLKLSSKRTRSHLLQSIEFFRDDSTSFSYDTSYSFHIERSFRPAPPNASKNKRKHSPKSTSTLRPTKKKTPAPTMSPTTSPTLSPTNSPSSSGSIGYPMKKTSAPTKRPSSSPTASPTLPTTSTASTRDPTSSPTSSPTKTAYPVLTLPPVNNVNGYTYCSSIPAHFVWQLNFTVSCEPTNIKYGRGTGIRRYTCNIDSADDSVTDLSPVIVQEFQIVELDDSLHPIFAEHHKNLSLYEGDIMNYTSVAVSDPSVKLGGISIKLVGTNSIGDEVNLRWTVEYKNSSSNAIVFCPGNSIGWTNFVSRLCEQNVHLLLYVILKRIHLAC
jgi:hypothetical protein